MSRLFNIFLPNEIKLLPTSRIFTFLHGWIFCPMMSQVSQIQIFLAHIRI